MTDGVSMTMTKCECQPDGNGYACVCACGMHIRATVPHVFHDCGAAPVPVVQQMASMHQQGGPGTALKKLLRRVGITATPTCPCNARAAQMDVWGPDECERRLDEIVDWLAEEAGKRRLPFIRAVGTQVVRTAIRRARNAAAK